MSFQPLAVIIALFALFTNTLALRINCRGGSICHSDSSLGKTDYADQLAQNISSIPDDTWIPEGAQIACMVDICAFLQNVEGLHAAEVKPLAWAIVDHGCRACGSAPISWPINSNVKNGELTFNYVSVDERCVDPGHVASTYMGVCPEFGGEVEAEVEERSVSKIWQA